MPLHALPLFRPKPSCAATQPESKLRSAAALWCLRKLSWLARSAGARRAYKARHTYGWSGPFDGFCVECWRRRRRVDIVGVFKGGCRCFN